MTDGPLIVQSDKTLLLEVDHPSADEARTAIAPFAELERAPEHVHTYRITPLALWNARAAGHDAEQVVDALVRHSRYPVPQPLLMDIVETMGRFGRLQLINHPAHGLVLNSLDRAVLEEVLRHKKIKPMLGQRIDDDIRRQRWTPRKPSSIWSAANIAHVERLTAEGLMRPAGIAAFERRTPERSGVYAYESGRELDEAQRARLLQIAEHCPVHRTLTAGVRVETMETAAAVSP